MSSPPRKRDARVAPGVSVETEMQSSRNLSAEPDVPQAFRNRRAFLIWALAIGAIPPERVVERVISEVEREARL